jgi:hypothetical protein
MCMYAFEEFCLWYMMSCNLIEVYRVKRLPTELRHVLEDNILYSHHLENFKSNVYLCTYLFM